MFRSKQYAAGVCLSLCVASFAAGKRGPFGRDCDYVLEAFFLQDVSLSYSDDLPHIRETLPEFIEELAARYPGSLMALGSFSDYPFVDVGFRAYDPYDYCFSLDHDFTANHENIQSALDALRLVSGRDAPEASLVALHHVGLGQYFTDPPVAPNGLNYARVIFLSTDADPHHAGDLQKALDNHQHYWETEQTLFGSVDVLPEFVVIENNGDAVMQCGQNVSDLLFEDYVTMDQVGEALQESGAFVVFLVTSNRINTWNVIAAQLKDSHGIDSMVHELEDDSSNLMEKLVESLSVLQDVLCESPLLSTTPPTTSTAATTAPPTIPPGEVTTAPPGVEHPIETPPAGVEHPIETPPAGVEHPIETPPPGVEHPIETPPPGVEHPIEDPTTPPPGVEHPIETPPPGVEHPIEDPTTSPPGVEHPIETPPPGVEHPIEDPTTPAPGVEHPIEDPGTACNATIDFMLLQDITASYHNDLPNIVRLIPDVVHSLQEQYIMPRFGVASFGDYPLQPLGSKSSDDYCYRLDIGLTDDTTEILDAIQHLKTRSGRDWKECQLEAMVSAARLPETNWRERDYIGPVPVMRVAALATDSGYHVAGDGAIAGITNPNTGAGVHAPQIYDYPSVQQTITAFKEEKIRPLFLVTSDVKPKYMKLLYEFEKQGLSGSVVTLADGSEEIVDAINQGLQELCDDRSPSRLRMLSYLEERNSP